MIFIGAIIVSSLLVYSAARQMTSRTSSRFTTHEYSANLKQHVLELKAFNTKHGKNYKRYCFEADRLWWGRTQFGQAFLLFVDNGKAYNLIYDKPHNYIPRNVVKDTKLCDVVFAVEGRSLVKQ